MPHGSDHLRWSDSPGYLGRNGKGRTCVRSRRRCWDLRRRVQGYSWNARTIRWVAHHRHTYIRVGNCRSRYRRRTHGDASRRRNAVRRFYFVRFRSDHELCRKVPVPLGGRGSHRCSRAERWRRSRRSFPFAESRNVLRAHAGPEGRLPGNCIRCQRAH